MARSQVNCDADIFVAGSTGHLGSTEDRAPSPIVMFGRGPSSTSTPISIMIMEESSMELGGSTSTLPSGDRAVFWTTNLYLPPPHPRVSLKRLLRWNYAELSLQQPCKNFVEFQWRNLRQSTIYRSLVKSGRESGRV